MRNNTVNYGEKPVSQNLALILAKFWELENALTDCFIRKYSDINGLKCSFV